MIKISIQSYMLNILSQANAWSDFVLIDPIFFFSDDEQQNFAYFPVMEDVIRLLSMHETSIPVGLFHNKKLNGDYIV